MVRESNRRSNELLLPRHARRRNARRDLILQAAARMFRQRGFAETGMRDIAEAADLSPANLYHYFSGKEEILFYCQDRALDRLLAVIAAASRTAAPAADRLHRVLAAHLRTILNEVEGATAHVQIEALSPVLRARIVRKRDRYERALRQLVTGGMASGEFVRMDPAVVTRAILGALNSTVTWYRPDGPLPADVIGDTIAAMLVRGLAARAAGAKRALRLVGAERRE